MERKSVVLSLICLVFVFSSVLLGLAYLDVDSEREELRSNVSELGSELNESRSLADSLRENVSSLRSRNSELEDSVESLERKNDRALVYAGLSSWYVEDGEAFVSVNTYNFGRSSADDLALKFVVYESTDAESVKETYDLDAGNLAGNSYDNSVFEVDVGSDVSSDAYGNVFVNYCSGNCLVLNQRIDGLGFSSLESSLSSDSV